MKTVTVIIGTILVTLCGLAQSQGPAPRREPDFYTMFDRMLQPGGELYNMMKPGGILHNIYKEFKTTNSRSELVNIGDQLNRVIFPMSPNGGSPPRPAPPAY